MKKLSGFIFLFCVSLSAFAWTIGPMNYQGRLLDGAGIPQTGTYNFTINIYDALTGGTLKFSEQQNSIAVTDGVYSFLVSTGTNPTGAWDINLWNTPSLYLEIVVNGQTLTPRHLLAAAPFAFQANLALTTNNALALGGKSAGNVLKDICASGKGKWLELASQCLGVGASFPGPTMVNLNTLTASTDLSNLDLTNADISGINFGSANFTGTIFKNTTMNSNGVGNADMTNTIWDGVSVIGTKVFGNNFTGAKISNVNMSGWNIASVTLTGTSIVDLTSCPAQLPSAPAQYRCRPIGGLFGQKYMIIGPNMNFSNSSLVNNRLDSSLNPDGTLFNNENSNLISIPINPSGSSFAGNNIEAVFLGVNLSNTNFTSATIRGWFESCDFTNANFSGATITKTNFYGVTGTGASFDSAVLNSVRFGTAGVVGQTSSFNFNSAVLDGVEFVDWGAGGAASLDFSQATLKNISLDATVNSLYAIDTNVYGGLYLGPNVSNVSFENMHFINGNLSGNWKNITDASSYYTNVSFNGADMTGSTGFTDNVYNAVSWLGAICPDGHHVTVSTDTCVGHFL